MAIKNELLQSQNLIISNYNSIEDEEEEATCRLSFCHNIQPGPITSSPAQTDELFEFFTGRTTRPNNDVVFFGKIINEEERLNEYEKRDYFATIRSQSSRKPDRDAAVDNRRRISSSTRYTGGDRERVNISSLTSMSAKSRRRMFMFGPVKFKPEMELSAIKQRQTRLSKAEKTVVVSGGARAVRSTNYITSVLARSFSCIPAVRSR